MWTTDEWQILHHWGESESIRQLDFFSLHYMGVLICGIPWRNHFSTICVDATQIFLLTQRIFGFSAFRQQQSVPIRYLYSTKSLPGRAQKKSQLKNNVRLICSVLVEMKPYKSLDFFVFKFHPDKLKFFVCCPWEEGELEGKISLWTVIRRQV